MKSSDCALIPLLGRVGRLSGIRVNAGVRNCTRVCGRSTNLARLVCDRGWHISGTGTGSRTGPNSKLSGTGCGTGA